MKFIRRLIVVACVLNCAFTLLANDPGGGANGVGANVTLTDNGSTVTLANGTVSATINKSSGEIDSILYLGTQLVLSGGGNVYYSMDGQPDYRTLSGCAYVIKTNTADMADVSFRQTWSSQVQAFDIEVHWVLRRGDSGLYAYAILDHPASYPDTIVGEWRMVWKLPNDVLNQAYIDELRHWQMPSSADIAAASATSIAEIVKLNTGVRAGYYDSKYEYAAEYENIGCWGHASNTRKIGAWFVTGNYEYFNDGPTKQDLTLAWDYSLIHFGRNHFSPGSVTHGTNGVAWQKIYGPFLLYMNTNSAGGDALWADAQAQVQAEHDAWPYSWLTGNANYPLADARGAVSGRFLATDTLKSSVSTSNAWVGLADPAVDWQFDSDHYEYWVRAAADGSFAIANVRPGTYTLHAFTDGEMGEYALSNVVVTVGATNALGDKTWSVPRTGTFLAWEVGVPNRTSSEYRHGSSNYYEGFIWTTFANEFSNPLEFNIGANDWTTDLNYAHSYYQVNGVNNQWKWRLNFLMTSVPATGSATLNIAFASGNGSNSQTNAPLSIFVNNESSAFTSIPPAWPGGGNALLREGIHAKYFTRQISIPVSNLRVGTNTITLLMTSTSNAAHFMYDAINLELPGRPPLPAGFDLAWAGGVASNRWDLATTANWSGNSVAHVFTNGNKVLFDDTGLNSPAILLANALAPGAVTIYAMKSFTFSGSGALTGAMALAKAGPGALTVNTTNTFTGGTFITNGTFVVNGSLSSSAATIFSGATLGGSGRLGAGLTMQAGSLLAPGNGPGTLTITNTFTESGGVTNRFDLSDDVTGAVKTNDLIRVVGNISASGTNTFLINPLDGVLADGIYPLIQYTGTLAGGITNFVVRGVVGKPFALTNFSGMLALVIISNRPPTNVVWNGGLSANAWDQSGTSNWLNGAALDVFAFDDDATFDNAGSTSPGVNLIGDLTPNSVTVDASVNYTFSGSGRIVGDGGLTKLNSGTLTILTTNDFDGPVLLRGGTLAVSALANGGQPGALGSASSDPTNLVFQSGATLRYLGGTAGTDRGLTFGAGGGTLDVANALATLTLNGTLTGGDGLVKIGPGMLALGGTNDYAGGTLVGAGALQVGAGATSGTLGTGNVTNNSLLIFNRADAIAVDNPITGSGSVVKSGGGTTTLTAANSYSGGTTNAAGVLVVSNSAALGSGPLIFTGVTGASVRIADGKVVTNAWLIPGSTADVMMDCPSGIGTWAGPVSVSSGGSFRPGTSGGGTLVYVGNASMGGANFIVPRGNVTIASNGVVSAGGTVCALGRSSSGTGTTFVARDNASLTFGSGLLLGHTSSGSPYPIVFTIQDNAVVSCGVSNLDLHNSVNTSATTTLNLNGGKLSVGGFKKSQSGASQTSVINFNGGTLKATASNAAFLGILSGLTANISTGGLIFDDNGFAISIGQSLVHNAALGGAPDGGLTKLGTGTLTFATPHAYTGPTVISSGTLALTAGAAVGSIANSASISIAADALLDVSGRTSLTILSGQTLKGNGSIKGNITIGSGAKLSPGNSIGTLTFSNSLTLAAGSTNIFEIGKLPLTNDVAKIFGTLTNGGTLMVTNIGASALGAGDRFKLFDAASYSGAFAGVQLPPLPVGLAWNTNGLNTNGTLSVFLNTAPLISSILLSSNQLTLGGAGGVGNADYFLLGATNLATPFSNWARLLTNQFDGSGGFNCALTNAATAPQSFYRIQLP